MYKGYRERTFNDNFIFSQHIMVMVKFYALKIREILLVLDFFVVLTRWKYIVKIQLKDYIQYFVHLILADSLLSSK